MNYVIYNAVNEGASDIHIEPGENVLRIRYRIDGRFDGKIPPAVSDARGGRQPHQDHGRPRHPSTALPQDGGIHVMMEKRPVDLRVGTMPGQDGEKVVIRVVDNDKARVNLEKLGFGYDTLKAWRKLIGLPNGIVLVTGPTAAAKARRLCGAAGVQSRRINICTVEDPIE